MKSKTAQQSAERVAALVRCLLHDPDLRGLDRIALIDRIVEKFPSVMDAELSEAAHVCIMSAREIIAQDRAEPPSLSAVIEPRRAPARRTSSPTSQLALPFDRDKGRRGGRHG
jgi:hypothetical protein